MTVPSTRFREDYAGNGSATSFPYAFRIFKAADLVVIKTDNSGNETTLTLGTDYTVTGAGSYNGGAVVLTTALPTSYRLTIERVLVIKQETDLRNQGEFLAETHEDAFDRLTMIVQRLAGYLGMGQDGTLRTMLLGTGDVDGAGAFRARGNRISGLGNPVSAQDAVNKAWFDQAVTTSVNQAANSAASAAASAAAAEDSEEAALAIATQFGDMATAVTQTEAARDTALSAKAAAQSSATSAASSAASASTAKSQAEAARDAAQLSSGVYADTTAGIAAVADGRYFSVPDGTGENSLILYRRSGSAAVEVVRYPSAQAFQSGFSSRAGYAYAVVDSDGKLVLGVKLDGALISAKHGDIGAALADLGALVSSSLEMRATNPRTGYLLAAVDNIGKMIFGITLDGDIAFKGRKLGVELANLSDQIANVQIPEAQRKFITPSRNLVFIGDSLTDGAGSQTTWRAQLPALLNGAARSSTNFAIGGQKSSEIAARMGAIFAMLTVSGNQIPASGPVVITDRSISLLTSAGQQSISGSLYGVPGTLARASDGSYSFTRTTDGSAVYCPPETPFIPDTLFSDAPFSTVFICVGRNDISDPETIKRNTRRLVEWIKTQDKHFIVLTPTNGGPIAPGQAATEGVGTGIYNNVVNIEQYIESEWGENCLNLRKFSLQFGNGSADDNSDIALGVVPRSLRIDFVHFTTAFHTQIANKVAQIVNAKGW